MNDQEPSDAEMDQIPVPSVTRSSRRSDADARIQASEVMATLSRCRWFKALNQAGLQSAYREGKVIHVPKGKVLFRAGDPTDDVYVILSGRVAISSTGASGREIGFREYSACDCFGEMAAVDGRPRSANATALASTLVFRIPAAGFRRLLADHPTVALEVLKSLARLVRALSDRIAENGVRAGIRIVAELVRMADAVDTNGSATRVAIMPAPTDEDMAARLDSQRESVNRVINELKRRGLISRSRTAMTVLDLPGLRRHLADLRS